MKKAKAGSQSIPPPNNVDEYFASVPVSARNALDKMREAIRSAVPSEVIETISYGIPAFKDKKVLVWYAAFSRHCSLFPTASVVEAFKDELKDFTASKGTIQFALDRPLPVALIKKIVKMRVLNEGKTLSRVSKSSQSGFPIEKKIF